MFATTSLLNTSHYTEMHDPSRVKNASEKLWAWVSEHATQQHELGKKAYWRLWYFEMAEPFKNAHRHNWGFTHRREWKKAISVRFTLHCNHFETEDCYLFSFKVWLTQQFHLWNDKGNWAKGGCLKPKLIKRGTTSSKQLFFFFLRKKDLKNI